MPITHPEHANDFNIIFGNKTFSISKCLFGLYSNYFKHHPSFLQKSLDMTENGINIYSFEQFIKACQGHFYNITNDNCFELLTLCNKYEVKVIKKEIKLFISNIDDITIIISRLKNAISQSESDNDDDDDNESIIDEIEETMAKRINLYLNEQSFGSLPVSNLTNIISKSISYNKTNSTSNSKNVSSDAPMKIDNHLFFSFLLSAFKYHKESSIVLFDLIEDYGEFTQDEINTLMANSPVAHNLMNSIFKSGLSSIAEKSKEQMSQIDSLRQIIKEIQDNTTKHINKVEKKVDHLKSDFETIKSRSASNLSSTSSLTLDPTFSISFTIPSTFSEVTTYETKNDKDLTINLNQSNIMTFLNEIQTQFDEYQTIISSNNETMNDFKENYNEIVSLSDEVNSKFDSFLNKFKKSELHRTESQERKPEKESAPLSKKKSHDWSFKDQKKMSQKMSQKENQKAQSVYSKKLTKKSNLVNSQVPELCKNLFEHTKEISIEYVQNSNNNNNDDQNELKINPHNFTSDPFNGIFKFLSRNININTTNLHDSNIIDIQASSSSSSRHPSMICESNNSWYWSSANKQMQWVKFDFKNMMVKVTHYSIQTTPSNPSTHLKNWVLEGTNAVGFTANQVQSDNASIKWETLDTRVNDMNLNGVSKIFTYEVNPSVKFFRYIRLKTTGVNHSGNHCLTLRRIEFFGTIKPFVENE